MNLTTWQTNYKNFIKEADEFTLNCHLVNKNDAKAALSLIEKKTECIFKETDQMHLVVNNNYTCPKLFFANTLSEEIWRSFVLVRVCELVIVIAAGIFIDKNNSISPAAGIPLALLFFASIRIDQHFWSLLENSSQAQELSEVKHALTFLKGIQEKTIDFNEIFLTKNITKEEEWNWFKLQVYNFKAKQLHEDTTKDKLRILSQIANVTLNNLNSLKRKLNDTKLTIENRIFYLKISQKSIVVSLAVYSLQSFKLPAKIHNIAMLASVAHITFSLQSYSWLFRQQQENAKKLQRLEQEEHFATKFVKGIS